MREPVVKSRRPTRAPTEKPGMTIQEGALAVGEKSGNLGMYLGLGVKEDIVEPENEICT